ncbi:hypothetical protein [uncultured Nitrosomonas sp.]|uniref:hypothetical protein n=1 Tax=uncultured Nitrosomonas sp. TaxID=156424 RepID=UPI0025D9DCF2|nr:hypothetical protein [uncultured Nitrosomonas sp.]
MLKQNYLIAKIFAIALFGFSGISNAACIQDQYGNQYTIVTDSKYKSITGTAKMAQCADETWGVIGSYVIIQSDKQYKIQEITAIRPQGSLSGCIDYFKLKGTYSEFAWYYDSGFGGQKSKFVACDSPSAASAADSTEGQGAIKR